MKEARKAGLSIRQSYERVGRRLVMMAGLMFFPLGVVGTLARKGSLPRSLNWD